MRKHPRYLVSMDAVIVRPGGESIPCRVADLSMGGAGIETDRDVPPDLGRFTLLVTEPSFELRVECEARQVRTLWEKNVVHAQFVGSDLQAPVERVLDKVRDDNAPFSLGLSQGGASIIRRLFRRRVA